MSFDSGIFSISLDFELHWGIFDKVAIDNRITYFNSTLEVIPKILNVFTENNIEVTWATVGMLFNDSIPNLKNNYPEKLPFYTNAKLSAYSFIGEGIDQKNSKYYLAKDLIEQIKNSKGQEIGTHTYSHFYALEPGQSVEAFEADIIKCVEIAGKSNIKLTSIVFPRNQVNFKYIDVCKKHGLLAVRVNSNHWAYNPLNKNLFLRKIFRTLDCYLPLFDTAVDIKSIEYKDVCFLPLSRFLRPITGVAIIDKLRLRRIKKEMSNAAKNGKYYHLWWHPHNFGSYPEQARLVLKELISHFKMLEKKYGMPSLNMENTINKLTI